MASWIRRSITVCLILALAPAVLAQWVEFDDDTAARLSAPSNLVGNDNQEKDYAWGDVDKDGDTDLVIVRKQPFTSPGKQPNVLLINMNGVLTDRTSDFATAGSVAGDNGFNTPTNDRDVILVDLNNNGWLDMVTATTISDNDPKHIGHPRIYRNLGCSTGGTSATSCSTSSWLGFYYDEPLIPQMDSYSGQSGFNPRFCSVSAGDLTGDGYPELWFGDYDSSGAGGSGQPAGADYNDKLLINRGAIAPGQFIDGTNTPGRFVGNVPGFSQSFEESAFGAANAIRDMNGDGFNDVVKQTSLNAPTYVGVAYNDSTPTLGFFDTFDVINNAAPYFVTIGNLNNDDQLDAVITDDGADRYLLNDNPGTDFVSDFTSFTFGFTGGSGDQGFGSNSLIVDLDKDGWNDVLIADVDVDIGGCNRRMQIYQNEGGINGAEPGDFVTLREQTQGSGCAPFLGNPATCIVASIPANDLEGVHDVAIFDLNGDTWDDMILGRCGGTEVYLNVPTGVPAGETDQLLLAKSGPTSVGLSWGDSCQGSDTDYSIYEGRLDGPPFTDHSSVTCSTGGSTSSSLSMSIQSSYYLIVPHNGVFEGSYGSASNGAPRQQGINNCRPTNVAACN